MQKPNSEEPLVFAPNPGPQTTFLASPADITIFGGGAGSGKSWALLLDGLRHTHNPLYRGITFRRMSTQLTIPDGLIDKSKEIYPYTGAVLKQRPWRWTWPSGATEDFGALQHEDDKLKYQGAAVAKAGWDELTHFTESQFFYLLSRYRTTSGIRPYVRATCNADAESWVRAIIDWWIGDDGFPIPERAGAIRYFIRLTDDEGNRDFIWANSAEELVRRYPYDTRNNPPRSFSYVPARVHDNPALLSKDPEYVARLKAMDYIDYARLYLNNWNVKASAGTVFNRSWFHIIDDFRMIPNPIWGTDIIYADLAATEVQQFGNSHKEPSYTAITHMRKMAGRTYILNSTWFQEGPAKTEELFFKYVELWGADIPGVKIRWEREPGSAGKREAYNMSRKFNAMGFHDAEGIPSEGDKIARAKPLATAAYQRNVFLRKGEWNDAFLTHLHNQPLTQMDIMDSASGAFNNLQDLLANSGSVNVQRGGKELRRQAQERRNRLPGRPSAGNPTRRFKRRTKVNYTP